MKTIKFTPKSLDKMAEVYFAASRNVDSNTMLENDPEAEGYTLVGIALRRWAVSIRRARKRAKKKDTQ